MRSFLAFTALVALCACTVGPNGVTSYAGPGTVAQLDSSCIAVPGPFQPAPSDQEIAACKVQQSAYMQQLQTQIAAQQQEQAAAAAEAAQQKAAAGAEALSQQKVAAQRARREAAKRETQQTVDATPSSGEINFDSPEAAQRHCPDDTVVWLNTNSGIYHYAGERWYGATEDGAFICERDAEAEGDRATENGQ